MIEALAALVLGVIFGYRMGRRSTAPKHWRDSEVIERWKS